MDTQDTALEISSYDRDDDLIGATRLDRLPRVRVCQVHQRTVVLGRGSKPAVELHLDACRQDRVPLQRRRGGGCAVVLDPGNLVLTVTLPVTGLGDNLRHFATISAWLLGGLARCGFDGIQHRGISDLALADRKVGGACIYRSKDLLCYSATLLVAPDVSAMQRYLKHPPREPDYRRGRDHTQFVGRLVDLKPDCHPDRLAQALGRQLPPESLPRSYLDVTMRDLSP